MILQLSFPTPVRRMSRGILHGTLHLALGAALLVVARPVAAQSGEGIAVGAMAPAVTVADASGKTVRVTPTIGRPMLIEFWATWCEFCERLEPTMKATYSKYGDKVQFAAIAVNVNQTPRRVAKHVKDRSLKYPVYYDDSGKATDAYDVAATSFVVIIDKKGRVAYTGVGDKQNLDAAIRGVL
jgi:cytochrome c biogenesis protein CcmG, thiol:disulfide interchange protein DsbE